MKISAISVYHQNNYSNRNISGKLKNSQVTTLLNDKTEDSVNFKGKLSILKGVLGGAAVGGGAVGIGVLAAAAVFGPVALAGGLTATLIGAGGFGTVGGMIAHELDKEEKSKKQ